MVNLWKLTDIFSQRWENTGVTGHIIQVTLVQVKHQRHSWLHLTLPVEACETALYNRFSCVVIVFLMYMFKCFLFSFEFAFRRHTYYLKNTHDLKTNHNKGNDNIRLDCVKYVHSGTFKKQRMPF